MKKIFVYSPYWSTRGGGEKYILTLSTVLAKHFAHRVTILSTAADIDKKTLEQFSNVDLSNVEFLEIHGITELRRIVGNADCFISQSNVRRIVTNARHHVQVIQIPYRRISPVSISAKLVRCKVRESMKDLLRLRLLSFSRERADLVLTYSNFVRDILLKNFMIKSTVLSPPIQDLFQDGFKKRNIILSVGRLFAGLYNNKRYDVMTDAFRRMCDSGLNGWEYHIIGTAATDHSSQEMIGELQEINKGYPIRLHMNESFDVMKRYYNEARIFWHAAGYGVDEDKHPENVEHFGMTTVEAMSAGCIPVVINRGGQKEIISNNHDGFFFDNADELIQKTVTIIQNKVDREILQKNARDRFRDYSMSVFSQHVHEIFGDLLNDESI